MAADSPLAVWFKKTAYKIQPVIFAKCTYKTTGSGLNFIVSLINHTACIEAAERAACSVCTSLQEGCLSVPAKLIKTRDIERALMVFSCRAEIWPTPHGGRASNCDLPESWKLELSHCNVKLCYKLDIIGIRKAGVLQ